MVDGNGQLLNYAGCGTPFALVNCFLFTFLNNFFLLQCNVGTYSGLLVFPRTTQRISFNSFYLLKFLIF